MWRKSSYSGPNGNCVEVTETPDLVLVRDSKDPAGPVLEFSTPEWREFVARLMAGPTGRRAGLEPSRSAAGTERACGARRRVPVLTFAAGPAGVPAATGYCRAAHAGPSNTRRVRRFVAAADEEPSVRLNWSSLTGNPSYSGVTCWPTALRPAMQ